MRCSSAGLFGTNSFLFSADVPTTLTKGCAVGPGNFQAGPVTPGLKRSIHANQPVDCGGTALGARGLDGVRRRQIVDDYDYDSKSNCGVAGGDCGRRQHDERAGQCRSGADPRIAALRCRSARVGEHQTAYVSHRQRSVLWKNQERSIYVRVRSGCSGLPPGRISQYARTSS